MARRGNHSLDQIKDMVLEAAENLVVEGGLNQLRVRNIAVKIGYTVGSIYMVFENMNDLILHIKGRTLDAISDEMDKINCDNPAQSLEALAGVYVNYADKNLNRWSMVFEHRLPDAKEAPEWYQNKLYRLCQKFEQQIAAINPELTPAQKKHGAISFLGGVHGICVLMLTTPIGSRKNLELCVKYLASRFTVDSCCDLEQEPIRFDGSEWGKQDLKTAVSTAC